MNIVAKIPNKVSANQAQEHNKGVITMIKLVLVQSYMDVSIQVS